MTDTLNPAPDNRLQYDPNLADVISSSIKGAMLNFNCHHLATIQSFNPEHQTVTATINYSKSFLRPNAITGVYSSVQVDYPLLVDVPVVIMQGGPCTLTFPIEAGDDCLILFNDRDIDAWFHSGQKGPLPTTKLHSFSDGIALVGLRHFKNSIVDYDMTRAVLQYEGGGFVGVGPTQVKIANETQTLKGVMNGLIDQLITLTGQITPTTGMTSANIAANIAALTLYKTTVAGLLE